MVEARDEAVEALISDLVNECERAIRQRDATLADPSVSNSIDGRTHDTIFGHIVRKHLLHITPHGGPLAKRAVDDLRDELRGRIETFRDMSPEDDESWESWYFASFDMLSASFSEIFGKHVSVLQRNPEGAVEPVAWRCTQWVDGNSQSMVTEWKETADARRELGEEVQPLYLHPPREQGTLEAYAFDLIRAGNELLFAAQTSGGTAGTDQHLINKIEGFSAARDCVLAALPPKATKGDGV